MSGFFRRPGVDSYENTQTDGGDEYSDRSGQENPLSKIETVEGSSTSGPLPTPIQAPPSTHNPQYLRDLALHSLLEEKALREAKSRLAKDASNEDVKNLAQSLYAAFYQQLPGLTEADRRLASDQMRKSRTKVQEGLSSFAQSRMAQLTSNTTGQPQSLVPRGTGRGSPPSESPFKNLPKQSVIGGSAPSTPTKTAFADVPVPPVTPLEGHPGLHFDHYHSDFVELDSIGKGGYGKVYKVKHKLDESLYAVKRIVFSQKRLERIQHEGKDPVSSILEEVRAMARFDHTNIVRYYYAWLEWSHRSLILSDSSSSTDDSRLLQNRSARSAGFDDESVEKDFGGLSLGEHSEPASDDNIVFGYSDSGPGPEISDQEQSRSPPSIGQLSPRRIARRESHATIETIISVGSRGSTRGHYNSEESEEKSIQGHQMQLTRVKASHYRREYASDSDNAGLLVPRKDGPVLTLNVQMSLYDTNLAAFLTSNNIPLNTNTKLETSQLIHCFHPCISLELLQKIHEGVDYLHSQGVVHRDLKPANIFLSVSDTRFPPAGSVDLSTCHPCTLSHNRPSIYLNPRIGDFGLVATLSDVGDVASRCAKPVGTEFYRPTGPFTISAKLDIFALGVVVFETLYKFDTKMERFETLTALKSGVLPADFRARLGTQHGAEIEEMVRDMVAGDEEERLDCEAVKVRLGNIVGKLKGVDG